MTKTVLLAGLLSIVAMGLVGTAYAQNTYLGNIGDGGETGKYTLEEALTLQRARVIAAEQNPAAGSGTPYLDAEGIFGASIISGAVFGGIAAAFFFRSRSGKYAAMGRG